LPLHPVCQDRRCTAKFGDGAPHAPPPVQDLDYEMDVRSVFHEIVI
jgi:hypothetical protein